METVLPEPVSCAEIETNYIPHAFRHKDIEHHQDMQATGMIKYTERGHAGLDVLGNDVDAQRVGNNSAMKPHARSYMNTRFHSRGFLMEIP